MKESVKSRDACELVGPFLAGERVVVRIGRDDFMPAVVDKVREAGYNVRVDQTWTLAGLARARPLVYVPFSARFDLFRGELR
jgi:hypothetical protein